MNEGQKEFTYLVNQRKDAYKKQIHLEVVSKINWLRYENEKSDVLSALTEILDQRLSRIIEMADKKDSKTCAYLILFTGANPKEPCLFNTSTDSKKPLDYYKKMPYLGGNRPKAADIFLRILEQPTIPLKLLYPRDDLLATYLSSSGGSNPSFECITLPTRIPLVNVRYFFDQQSSHYDRFPKHVDIEAVNPSVKYSPPT